MPPQLITCPACECHAKSSESSCPHCGAPLPREGNRVPRSATAVALGLSAVLVTAGCNEGVASPVYGVATTGGFAGSAMAAKVAPAALVEWVAKAALVEWAALEVWAGRVEWAGKAASKTA